MWCRDENEECVFTKRHAVFLDLIWECVYKDYTIFVIISLQGRHFSLQALTNVKYDRMCCYREASGFLWLNLSGDKYLWQISSSTTRSVTKCQVWPISIGAKKQYGDNHTKNLYYNLTPTSYSSLVSSSLVSPPAGSESEQNDRVWVGVT